MPVKTLSKLFFLTVLTIIAMNIKDYYLGVQHPGYYFNILMSLIPVALLSVLKAIYVRTCDLTHPGLLIVFGAWMIFFPNSAYLVIDPYLHVQNVVDAIAYLPSVILGTTIAISSFKEIDDIVSVGIDETVSSIILVTMFFISSFGLYLGLFGRWNSWDLFTQPVSLLAWSIDNLLISTPFCLVSTTSLAVGYFYGKKILNPSII